MKARYTFIGAVSMLLLNNNSQGVKINANYKRYNKDSNTELVQLDNNRLTLWRYGEPLQIQLSGDEDPNEAWTKNRMDAINETSWEKGAPKDYKVEPMELPSKEGSEKP